jgi:protein-tyrosine phosphatase
MMTGCRADRLRRNANVAADDVLTSEASPLRVDWVPLEGVPGLVGTGGGLGMTFLPGKQHDGRRGRHRRDLRLDLARLRGEYAVDALLLLVEDHELEASGVPDIATACAAQGIELLRFPVRDVDVPADRAAFGAWLDGCRKRVATGQRIAVACLGGLGRTGTAVACLLIDAGLEADAAIRLTRETRHGTIETPAQESFVRAWKDGSGSR